MTLPLYDLEPCYEALVELPLEEENPVTSTALCQMLDEIRDEASAKALSLAKVVNSLQAELELIEQQIRLLQAKAQARRERIAFLRTVIHLELEAAGVDRIRDPLVTVWLQKSPPSVEVIDEESVPAEFKRAVLRLPFSLVPPELRGHLQHLDVNRAAILELVKRTGEVPDGVSVRTGERHLRIR